MDNFREEIIVKRNRALNSFLYMLCWVGVVLFGAVALMNFSSLMAGMFELIPIIVMVVCGGIAFLLWRNKDVFRTEYEYTFTNGDLDVAKVLANSRRKYLTALSLKTVEACGEVTHASFQRYVGMQDVKKHNWFLNRDSKLYYFYFVKNSVKHLIVLELSDEMVELVRKYLAYGIWQG